MRMLRKRLANFNVYASAESLNVYLLKHHFRFRLPSKKLFEIGNASIHNLENKCHKILMTVRSSGEP